MDPFTEKLLERTRQRRENLARKMSSKDSSPQQPGHRKKSPQPGLPLNRKRPSPLTETSVNRIEHDGETPVKRQAPAPPELKSGLTPEDPPPGTLRSRLGKLAARHKALTGDEEDPENAPSPNRSERTPPVGESLVPQPAARRTRLAALASTINNWEDDLSHHGPRTRTAALSDSKPKHPVPSPRQSTPSESPVPAKPPRGVGRSRSPLTVTSPRASPIAPVSPSRSPVKASPLKPPRRDVASRFISPSRQLQDSPVLSPPVQAKSPRAESPMKTDSDHSSPVRMTRSRSRTSMTSLRDEPTSKPVSARMGMWEQRVQNNGGPVTPSQARPSQQPASPRGLASPVRIAGSSPVKVASSNPSPVRASPGRLGSQSPGRTLASPARGLASPARASPLKTDSPKTTTTSAQSQPTTSTHQSPKTTTQKSPRMKTPTKSASDNYIVSAAKRDLGTPEKVRSKVGKTMSFSDSIAARAREFEENFEPKRKILRQNSKVGDRTKQLQERLLDKTQNSWRENEICSKISREKNSDLEVVKNRWNTAGKEQTVGSQDQKKPVKKIDMNSSEDEDSRMQVDDDEGFHTPVAHLSNQARLTRASVTKGTEQVAKETVAKPVAKEEKSKSKREESRNRMRSEFENKLAAMGFEMSSSTSTHQKYHTVSGRGQPATRAEPMETDDMRLRHKSEEAKTSIRPTTCSSIKSSSTEVLPPSGKTGQHKIWARVKTFEKSQEEESKPNLRRRRSSARKACQDESEEEAEAKEVRFSSRVDMAPTPVMQDYTETESDFSESDSFLHIEARQTVTVKGQGQGQGQGQGYSSMESDETDMLESIERTMGNDEFDTRPRAGSSSSSTVTGGESSQDSQSEGEDARHRDYDADNSAPELETEAEDADELCAEMDDLLDSMVSEDDTDASLPHQDTYNVRTRTVTGPSTAHPSRSQTSQGSQGSQRSQQNSRSQPDSLSPDEDGRTSPLVYSISAYRSMRSNKRHPPAQMHIVREPERNSPAPKHNTPQNVSQKIQKLNDLVKQEQAVIIQTTNALNQCCSKNSQFAGSQEQVECNKLLLIACQRRQAYIEEISHLKNQGGAPPAPAPGECRGSLTISDIRLPLKRDFINKIGSREDTTVHYFLVLVRNGPHLIVTEMVSSHDGGVRSRGHMEIPNLVKLSDVTSNFKLTLEIYSMSVVREHEHEKAKKKSGFTPKKLLSKKKHAESPVTAMSVSTTNFRLISSVNLSLKSVHNSSFTLPRVPSLCPLGGVVTMKLRCILESTVEERGFLTMFEDVSGFGAWHRRWCVLHNNKIKFWKYPDDEKHKEPMGTIDLKSCVTEEAGLIPRDVCARPHTFLLTTVRAPQSGDRNTLVSWRDDTLTKFKHMLSADTKQDRVLWCDKINQTLRSIRTWQPDALPPMRGDRPVRLQ